jgi:putative phosphoesterase
MPHPALRMPRIGVISDTHGLLRPEVIDAFAGVDHIIHAGDIGGDEIIRALKKLAPVTFVRGNNDDASGYEIKRVTVGGLRILVTHILPRPRAAGKTVRAALQRDPADVVVFGHSHLPHDEVIEAVRFFNPASAGPRRFDYPVAVGIIEADRAWHIALDERSQGALKKRMNQLS